MALRALTGFDAQEDYIICFVGVRPSVSECKAGFSRWTGLAPVLSSPPISADVAGRAGVSKQCVTNPLCSIFRAPSTMLLSSCGRILSQQPPVLLRDFCKLCHNVALRSCQQTQLEPNRRSANYQRSSSGAKDLMSLNVCVYPMHGRGSVVLMWA